MDKILCDNGATGTWDNDKWAILIENATRKIKCSVFFKERAQFDFDYTKYKGACDILPLPSQGKIHPKNKEVLEAAFLTAIDESLFMQANLSKTKDIFNLILSFSTQNTNSGIENGAGGSAGTGSEGNASSTPSSGNITSGGSNEGADSGSGSTGSGENSALQNPSES